MNKVTFGKSCRFLKHWSLNNLVKNFFFAISQKGIEISELKKNERRRKFNKIRFLTSGTVGPIFVNLPEGWKYGLLIIKTYLNLLNMKVNNFTG